VKVFTSQALNRCIFILMLALVFLVLLGILGSALLMFWWAASVGQFENVEDGALAVFDADEPAGQTTDSFPDPRR
jgi:cbb3-type cytochrome oxidase maturation protein